MKSPSPRSRSLHSQGGCLWSSSSSPTSLRFGLFILQILRLSTNMISTGFPVVLLLPDQPSSSSFLSPVGSQTELATPAPALGGWDMSDVSSLQGAPLLHLVKLDSSLSAISVTCQPYYPNRMAFFFFVIFEMHTGFLEWNSSYRMDYVLNIFNFCHPQGVTTLSPGMFSLVQCNKHTAFSKYFRNGCNSWGLIFWGIGWGVEEGRK